MSGNRGSHQEHVVYQKSVGIQGPDNRDIHLAISLSAVSKAARVSSRLRFKIPAGGVNEGVERESD